MRPLRRSRATTESTVLDRTRLYPGVDEMLRDVHAGGTRLAVLTNKPRRFSEAILLGLGVRELFSGVIGGDDLPTQKPDPAGLHRLRLEAECEPRDVLMVGDSPVDLRTARNAGAEACAVVWGFVRADVLRAEGASRLVERPSEIAALVRGVPPPGAQQGPRA